MANSVIFPGENEKPKFADGKTPQTLKCGRKSIPSEYTKFRFAVNCQVAAAEENRQMRRKFKKIVLIIVCGVLAYAAISAVFRSWQEKRLKQEIADIRRTLREQGFKTELDDFKVSTDPAMRARVKTLLALGYEPKLDTNNDYLDFQPVISNGVAKVLWKRDALSLDTNIFQWADFRAVLNKERERLDAACDAALQGPIQSDLDLTNNAGFWNGNIGHLVRISRTLSYRVILNLHDGNPDAAWTNLLATTHLVTAWKVEPTPISHLLRATMVDSDFALTWQALQFNHWPDDRLSALQSEWESVDFFTNSSETMGLWRVEDFNLGEKLLQKPPTANFRLSEIAKLAFQDPSEAFREAGDNYQETHYRGNKVLNDEKNLLLYLRDRELELRHAIQSPTWAQMRAQPGITNAPQFKSPLEEITQLVNGGSRLAFRLTAINGLAEAERRILITAITLERFRGKYGSYPDSLAALAPEFLMAVPVDFMDGQPLRYRPTNNGHFLLYSVGLDCVDDGGKPPAPDEPRYFSNNNGAFVIVTNVDIVWPIPATP